MGGNLRREPSERLGTRVRLLGSIHHKGVKKEDEWFCFFNCFAIIFFDPWWKSRCLCRHGRQSLQRTFGALGNSG
jgi:hypothetical protein